MKIYFNNLPLFLQNPSNVGKKKFYNNVIDLICCEDVINTQKKIKDLIHQLMSGTLEVDAVFVVRNHLKNHHLVRQQFLQNFRSIEAAGGVVFNEKEEVLLIYRNNKWDLPKGKIERGETIEVAAIREVEEETGLRKVNIQATIYPADASEPATYHTYTDKKGQYILKTTYWFKMLCASKNQTLMPQMEEGITQVKWVTIDQLPSYLVATYPSIKDVFHGLQP